MNPMRIALILFALVCGLQGCGLKGPLVLPDQKGQPPAAQTTPPVQPTPAQQDK